MKNMEIKQYAKEKNIRMWEIAEYLKIHESVLSRKMRHELKEEEKQKIFIIINNLSKGR